MRTRAKCCENCHAPVINSEGDVIKMVRHLIRDKHSIYICDDCFNTDKHIIYEEFGFRQSNRKLLARELLDFDDCSQSS